MEDESTRRDGKAMKRRGILAAAGAVVAGIAAKQASQPVAAGAPAPIYHSTDPALIVENDVSNYVHIVDNTDFNLDINSEVMVVEAYRPAHAVYGRTDNGALVNASGL